MTKIFFLIFLAFGLCIEVTYMEINHEFLKFIKNYDRQYDSVEETLTRYKIFAENYKRIQKVNNEETDVELAVNQFADLTQEEFKATYLGYSPSSTPCTIKHKKTNPKEILDWRKDGAVTIVKNQAQCGSCWAFSAVCALEGLNAIKNKKLIRYSEQELVDCSSDYGENHGCKGGDMSQAFEYVKDNGISLESEYPYKARTMACRKSSSVFKISGCVNVTHENNMELLEALAIGPISVGVRANNVKFMYYKNGIIQSGCGTAESELDHGITIVGAAIKDDLPYWIVRNSWGASWGESGYVYIKRDTNKGQGVCGIAMEPSYPVA